MTSSNVTQQHYVLRFNSNPTAVKNSKILIALLKSNVTILCLQWDLVCERAYLKDLTQTIFVVGLMFGSTICSALSDKFGRKPVFLISQWALVVVGVVNAFAPNYIVFIVLRFFAGLLTVVRFLLSSISY